MNSVHEGARGDAASCRQRRDHGFPGQAREWRSWVWPARRAVLADTG